MLIPEILIGEIILGTNEYTAWTVVTPRYRHEEIGVFFQWFAVLSYDVIQAKIKFI